MLNHAAFIHTTLLIIFLILSWGFLESIQDYDMLKMLSGSSPSIQNELRSVEQGSNSYPPSPAPAPLPTEFTGFPAVPSNSSHEWGDESGEQGSNSYPPSPAPAPLPIESTGFPPVPSNSIHEWGDESGENRNLCDIYSGRWVFDPSYPIYNSSSCPYMEDGWRCQENGRPDTDYLKWRWQPSACDLPRFNASRMLQMLKNKRVVFSGDSLGRNQWQSFLCMLYQGLENKSRVFETRGQGNRISGVFKFQDYNLTVEYYVSHFLILETRKPPNAPIEAKSALRLDLVTSSYKQWLGGDILIFNTGHWWDHKDLRTGAIVFQEGNSAYPSMEPGIAYAKALKTWAKWIDTHLDLNKAAVFFRGYATSHFVGATWDKGGRCDLETQPWNESFIPSYPQRMRDVEIAVSNMKVPPIILNVTQLSDMRKDGHISIWKMKSGESMSSRIKHQDCSHWCLPGIPDTWNELLYYYLLRQEKT